MTAKRRYRVTGRRLGCSDCEAGAEHPPHGIGYPADPAIVEALIAGEEVEDRGEMKELTAGDVADDIPVTAITGFLELGLIEPTGRKKKGGAIDG